MFIKLKNNEIKKCENQISNLNNEIINLEKNEEKYTNLKVKKEELTEITVFLWIYLGTT